MRTNRMNPDVLSALFWLLFALFVCRAGFQMGVGDRTDPGAGFIFFWTALIQALLSLIVLGSAMRSGTAAANPEETAGSRKWWRVITVISALWAYALVLERVGFVLSTFLLVSVFMTAAGPSRWHTTLLVALAAALGAYGVFHLWLGVSLPAGNLWFQKA